MPVIPLTVQQLEDGLFQIWEDGSDIDIADPQAERRRQAHETALLIEQYVTTRLVAVNGVAPGASSVQGQILP